jgi:hypothetical protein
MGTNYEHLTAEERATLMVMRADGCSQRGARRAKVRRRCGPERRPWSFFRWVRIEREGARSPVSSVLPRRNPKPSSGRKRRKRATPA